MSDQLPPLPADFVDYDDGDKLRLIAAWFDMYDAADAVKRQSLLDEADAPGRNDVQSDLRRMARRLKDIDAKDQLLAELAELMEALPSRRVFGPAPTGRSAEPGTHPFDINDLIARTRAALES